MTENKLTIEHLAAFLPYGLKLQYLVRDKPEREGVMTKIIHNENETHPTKVSIDYYDAEHIWMFKPYLRPLSHLTQEIEHNGERFVPLYKLFEIEYKDTAHVENIREMYINIGTRFLSCSHLGTAVELSINIQEIEKNNYWKIKKLHEWNFDLHSLIDHNLALPIED